MVRTWLMRFWPIMPSSIALPPSTTGRSKWFAIRLARRAWSCPQSRPLSRLINGVRHRLFEIDVFALVHGFDCDLRVPMVRRRNDNAVDVLGRASIADSPGTRPLAHILGSPLAFLINIRDGEDLYLGRRAFLDVDSFPQQTAAAPATPITAM